MVRDASLFAQSEVLLAQVLNHRVDAALVGLSLVWHDSEVELLLRRLETVVGLRDKVGSPVCIHSLLSLFLSVRLRAHRNEGQVVGRRVEVGTFSHREVGLRELLALLVTHALINHFHLRQTAVHNLHVRFVHGAVERLLGRLVSDRRASDFLAQVFGLLGVFQSLRGVHGRGLEVHLLHRVVGRRALAQNPRLFSQRHSVNSLDFFSALRVADFVGRWLHVTGVGKA